MKNYIKKFLAGLLLVVIGLNGVSAYNKVVKNIIIGVAGTLAGGCAIGGTAVLIHKSRTEKVNSDNREHSNHSVSVKDWKQAAQKWMNIYQKSEINSPERFEALAEYNRCKTYIDRENCDEAVKNYRRASKLYWQCAQKAGDKSSYEYQINAAKSAELKAKAGELYYGYGECRYNPGMGKHCCMSRWGPCRTQGYKLIWNDLIGKKPSYDAYAKAKQLEAYARLADDGYSDWWIFGDHPEIKKELYSKTGKKLWIEAAEAWENVKTDAALLESFPSAPARKAFIAFAHANKLECRFKAGLVTAKEVADSWNNVYEKDKQCHSSWHEAFAEEAKAKKDEYLMKSKK